MERNRNHKLKILYLMKIMLSQTDSERVLSMAQIISALGKLGITAERKSVYADFVTLRAYGIDIKIRRGRHVGYYAANRHFEHSDLELLACAVRSAGFISGKKGDELISKLSALALIYDAALPKTE